MPPSTPPLVLSNHPCFRTLWRSGRSEVTSRSVVFERRFTWGGSDGSSSSPSSAAGGRANSSNSASSSGTRTGTLISSAQSAQRIFFPASASLTRYFFPHEQATDIDIHFPSTHRGPGLTVNGSTNVAESDFSSVAPPVENLVGLSRNEKSAGS